jgi:hypothetical protein
MDEKNQNNNVQVFIMYCRGRSNYKEGMVMIMREYPTRTSKIETGFILTLNATFKTEI